MYSKPSPAVYSRFVRRAVTIGAASAAMLSAWMKQSEHAPFDLWHMQPTIALRGLSKVQALIVQHVHRGSAPTVE